MKDTLIRLAIVLGLSVVILVPLASQVRGYRAKMSQLEEELKTCHWNYANTVDSETLNFVKFCQDLSAKTTNPSWKYKSCLEELFKADADDDGNILKLRR